MNCQLDSSKEIESLEKLEKLNKIRKIQLQLNAFMRFYFAFLIPYNSCKDLEFIL